MAFSRGPEPAGRRLRPYDEVAAVVDTAVDAFRTGNMAAGRRLVEMLEDGPPDAAALVGRVLADLTARRVVAALAHGWSHRDLDEVGRRRLKARSGASATERGVRLLELLAGLPRLPPVAPPTSAPTAEGAMLAKVRALLAKAESTTFPEEAELLSAKAQELMARHRFDRVLVEDGATGTGPVGRRIWLDDPYADAKGHLLAVVARANRCRSVLLGGLGCSHLIGFADDLDMTELLHTSLLVQATRAMAAAGPQADARGRSRTRSFRQSFLVAYAWRIGGRLRDTADATEAEVDTTRGGGLLPVLARREARIEDATKASFPHAKRQSLAVSNGAGWAAGAAAAEMADLGVGQALPR
jgi:hypothetical protein